MSQTTLQSMTGFAGTEGSLEGYSWRWEIRSVNGKGLDIRLRLPSGLERLEQEIRKRVSSAVKRGSIYLSLAVEDQQQLSVPVINQSALDAVLSAIEDIAGRTKTKKPTADGILALRGVLELVEAKLSPEHREHRKTALLASLDAAIDAFCQVRMQEGAALAKTLAQNVDTIENLTQKAEQNPSRSVEAINARIGEQIGRIMDASSSLDEDRLYQEAAILATKADIKEEIDRLFAHIAAARQLLAGSGPVGRKLDFLAQEFNREANTLCSKSNASEITAIGLELKVIIDQFREQIQNLE